jgi:hypothetical protein
MPYQFMFTPWIIEASWWCWTENQQTSLSSLMFTFIMNGLLKCSCRSKICEFGQSIPMFSYRPSKPEGWILIIPNPVTEGQPEKDFYKFLRSVFPSHSWSSHGHFLKTFNSYYLSSHHVLVLPSGQSRKKNFYKFLRCVFPSYSCSSHGRFLKTFNSYDLSSHRVLGLPNGQFKKNFYKFLRCVFPSYSWFSHGYFLKTSNSYDLCSHRILGLSIGQFRKTSTKPYDFFSILLFVFSVDISEQVSPQVLHKYLVLPLCVNTQP